MRFESCRRCKFRCLYYDNKNKIIKNFNKHASCNYKCKRDDRKCNSVQIWNKELCQCERKKVTKHHLFEKDFVWNLSACTFEKIGNSKVFLRN